MSLYRWIREGTLQPTINPGMHGGIGMEFSPDDVRLAAMLAQFHGDGHRSHRWLRRALSVLWYDGPSALVVIIGDTIHRADSVPDAVSIASAARGVATVLWPDRILGWA